MRFSLVRPSWSLSKLTLVLAVLLMGSVIGLTTHKAAADSYQNSYFNNQANQCVGKGGCDFVFPNGEQATSASGLISDITNMLNNGTAQEKTGAAFVIDTMTGAGVNRNPSSSTISTWEQIVNGIASGQTANCSVNWNQNYQYTQNTMYDQYINDIIPYSWNPTPSNPALTDMAIVFSCNGGAQTYVIKHLCGNPLGNLSPLPPPGWTLSGASTVDGHTGTETVKPGTTHIFRHQVYNNGPAAANYNWKVMDDSSGSFANHNLPTGSPNNVAAGSSNPALGTYASTYTAKSQYSVPSNAANGTTYCQEIQFTNASYPPDSNGNYNGSSTKVCVTVQSGGGGCASNCTPSCTGYKVSDADDQDGQGYNSFTEVTITGTDSDTSGYNIDHGGSHNFTYNALSPTMTITVGTYYNNDPIDPSGNLQPQRSYTLTFKCYHATCGTPTVIDGEGPGGSILAGQQFSVEVPVTNDNTSAYTETIPSSLDNGDYNFSITEAGGDDNVSANTAHNTGFSLDPGETETATLSPFTAPSSVRYFTLTFYPDMAPHGSLNTEGATCSVKIPIYQQFAVTNEAPKAALKPTKENPSEADYSTQFDLNSTNPSIAIPQVGIPSTSTYTAVGVLKDSYTSNNAAGGDYSAGTHTWTGNSPDKNVHADPTSAGSEYCANLTLSYTSGFIGPGGPSDVQGPSGPYNQSSCDRIVNEPYLKVYNSGISAGGDFNQCSSTDGGLLAGYNDSNDPPNMDRGSGSQLSDLALLAITGVASAQTDPARSPTDLTFANAGSGVNVNTNDSDSPALGGNFGSCLTLTNETPQQPTANMVNNTKLDNLNGAYTYSGNLTIPASNLTKSHNVSVFVTGNVYISGPITFNNSGAVVGTVPSLVIHATGNIYIDPGVTSLSGIYIAQQATDAHGNPDTTTGKIYTCADSTGFAPMSVANLYAGCNDQLVVYGSFVADQINLMRTLGSLRDEAPTGGSPAIAGSPGSAGAAAPLTTNSGTCTPLIENDDTDWRAGNAQLCVPAQDQNQNQAGYPTNQVTLNWTNNGHPNGNYCTASWGSVLRNQGYPRSGTDGSLNSKSSSYTWDDDYLCSNIPITFSTNQTSGNLCTLIPAPTGQVQSAGWPTVYVCVQAGSPSTSGTDATLGTVPTNPACSNPNLAVPPSITSTCGGEVFEFSPELYLSNPAVEGPSNGAPQYQAWTSLPPVL